MRLIPFFQLPIHHPPSPIPHPPPFASDLREIGAGISPWKAYDRPSITIRCASYPFSNSQFTIHHPPSPIHHPSHPISEKLAQEFLPGRLMIVLRLQSDAPHTLFPTPNSPSTIPHPPSTTLGIRSQRNWRRNFSLEGL